MKEFPIMAMKEGDEVTVTGYYADPQKTGTVSWWDRHEGTFRVCVQLEDGAQVFDYEGQRPHRFWR